jgi:hypothetical protein
MKRNYESIFSFYYVLPYNCSADKVYILYYYLFFFFFFFWFLTIFYNNLSENSLCKYYNIFFFLRILLFQNILHILFHTSKDKLVLFFDFSLLCNISIYLNWLLQPLKRIFILLIVIVCKPNKKIEPSRWDAIKSSH